MSRTIEFRGLKPNGEFVYGSLVNNCVELPNGVGQNTKTWIVTSAFGNGGWFNIRGRSYVKPETIGQFTGLLDRNGVKIFEGDTAKTPCGHAGAVMFSGASFYVEGYDSGDYYQGQNPDSWDWSKFEVIGNIHQNSELMK